MKVFYSNVSCHLVQAVVFLFYFTESGVGGALQEAKQQQADDLGLLCSRSFLRQAMENLKLRRQIQAHALLNIL